MPATREIASIAEASELLRLAVRLLEDRDPRHTQHEAVSAMTSLVIDLAQDAIEVLRNVDVDDELVEARPRGWAG